MDRYDWPGERDPERQDQAEERGDAIEDFLSDVHGSILSEASALRAQLLGALSAGADENVWVPIGPSATVQGQANSRPRVAGRVRDLAVSDDGLRVYAATANGGLWYSGDAGLTWHPIGGAGSTPAGEAAAPGPNSLVIGCLLVDFGAAADGSGDTVYVGTGEIKPRFGGQPGVKARGIGVLKLDRSLPSVLADPYVNPWKREAVNLAGAGIFRLAWDPADHDSLVAASSIGLFKRQGAFQENAPWQRVTTGPFDFDADDNEWCTDVVWAPSVGATPSRLWVALVDPSFFSDTGVWVSEDGANGPWDEVSLSGSKDNGRLGIAVHRADPSIAYVLGKGPRLWRIDGKTARRVGGIPGKLFGRTKAKDQSSYDLALDVHPSDPAEVIVGGSTVRSEGQWSASLFRLTVGGTAAADDFEGNFDDANKDDPGADTNSYIGHTVHADVHAVRYAGAPAGSQVWVGCDGGVFCSAAAGDAYTFHPRNTGLAVVEAGFVAGHPTQDGALIIGTQDNGAQQRIGNTIWTLWIHGDGGGVAYHPTRPAHFAGQYTRAKWHRNKGSWVAPVWRAGSSKDSKATENRASSFYSNLHIIPGASPTTARVALGTSRVWISEDWDPMPGATAMTWRTLPSRTDPRAGGSNNTSRDTFKGRVGQVRAVKWSGPPGSPENRLLALCRRAILGFTRNPADNTWKRTVISRYNEKCGDDETDNDEITRPTSDVLPALGAWSDLAVQDPARGTHGSFYVSATGAASFDDDTLVEADRMDTLWWYDGTGTWHPTGLRGHANATRAPAYAVVVDPDNVTVVYVGTGVGVWRGEFEFVNGAPEWDWEIFSNGLPDGIIQDLSFFKDGSLKLLRAAVQSRGVWEVDLSASPTSPRRTYLRAHPYDTRRRAPANLANPDKDPRPVPAGGFQAQEFFWHGSPDLRVRAAPGSAPPARPHDLPWTRNNPGAAYPTWVLQTAMHATNPADPLINDPLVRPTGRWTPLLEARIKRHRARLGMASPNTAIVDGDFWDALVIAGKCFDTPWDTPAPSEADHYELIVERDMHFTPQGFTDSIRAAIVDRRPQNVDVLVHHRHFEPEDGNDVSVLLLRRQIISSGPSAEGDGAGVALGATWKTAVTQRMAGASPAVPDWDVIGLASPTSPVSARTPRIVTFATDFTSPTTFVTGSTWMLLAIVSSVRDPVSAASLTGGTVRDLVLNSHHVAARLVYLAP